LKVESWVGAPPVIILDGNSQIRFPELMIKTLRRMLTPFTILVSFTEDSLTFTEDESRPVSFPYRDHPEVFGHPRFLMIDFDKSATLVRSAVKQLAGDRRPLIAPKMAVSVERSVQGGITDMDQKIIGEILTNAGALKVIWKNA